MRATWLVSIATALVLLGASILVFLNPAWVGFEQDRTDVTRLTGYAPTVVRDVTSSILGDLVLVRGDFDVTVAGAPVLTPGERQHMRDVRGVFAGLGLLVLASIGLLVVTWRGARERDSRARWWRAVRTGAAGLAIGIAILGATSIVAFDAAFEVFHRLFFAAGTYDFDPATSHLVQLFPDRFWNETAIALGVVALGFSVVATLIAGPRAAGPPAKVMPESLVAGRLTR